MPHAVVVVAQAGQRGDARAELRQDLGHPPGRTFSPGDHVAGDGVILDLIGLDGPVGVLLVARRDSAVEDVVDVALLPEFLAAKVSARDKVARALGQVDDGGGGAQPEHFLRGVHVDSAGGEDARGRLDADTGAGIGDAGREVGIGLAGGDLDPLVGPVAAADHDLNSAAGGGRLLLAGVDDLIAGDVDGDGNALPMEGEGSGPRSPSKGDDEERADYG